MKKFQFRLNAFLGYRKHLEQEARQAVTETRNNISACQKRIAGYQAGQRQNMQELSEKMAAGIKAQEIPVYFAYYNRLQQMIQNENQTYLQLQKELIQKQQLLKQRVMEKKAIENLKQRKKEEYYKELERLLQKETEDMVIMKKIREINQ